MKAVSAAFVLWPPGHPASAIFCFRAAHIFRLWFRMGDIPSIFLFGRSAVYKAPLHRVIPVKDKHAAEGSLYPLPHVLRGFGGMLFLGPLRGS